MAAIPLHLISGFLGSGKTTFLTHYLDNYAEGRKIGVIQNEFSPSGIDGVIIRNHNRAYRMLEINNGSVFCVCLLGSFIESLSAFLDDNSLDEIIMEASGMSDPVSVGQIFQSVKLRDRVYLAVTWTVVDARNYFKVTSIRPRIEHQIRIADMVVLNKIDLAGDDVESIFQSINRINPFATILKCSFAKISYNEKKTLLKKLSLAGDNESCRPNLQSVIIKSNHRITSEKLKEFIDSVKGDFIRFKGFVNLENDQKVMVQGVFDDYTFKKLDWFAGVTELIGIGNLNGMVNYSEIFEGYCH